jgi:hypothetical protein
MKLEKNMKHNSEMQHIRTSSSRRTLLFVRIASAIAQTPSLPMSLKPCETMQIRRQEKGNAMKHK